MPEHDDEHDHRFPSRRRPTGTLVFCEGDECGAMLVWGEITLRKLTADETVTVMAHMMEAISIGEAMVMIHGQEYGIERARQVLGYK